MVPRPEETPASIQPNAGNGSGGGATNSGGTVSRNQDAQIQQLLNQVETMTSFLNLKKVKTEQENQLEQNKSIVRDAITAALTDMSNLSLDPETQRAISEKITEVASTLELMTPAPARLADARMMAMDKSKDEKGVVSKLVSRIPKFSGENEEYNWSTFLTCYSMAVANANYSSSELRSIFLQCLEGSALVHYSANEADYGTLKYEDLINRFEERYGEKIRDAIDALMAMEQGVNEKVLAYRDRLMNVAKRVLPVKPSKVYLLKSTTQEKFMFDTMYEQKLKEYHMKLERDMVFVIRNFVGGLRDEILDRMTTTAFDTLDSAVKAAEQAEDYLQFRTRAKANHIKVSAVSATPKSKPRSRSSSRDGRAKGSDACHKCGKSGHWAAQCRKTDFGNSPPSDDLRNMVKRLCSKVEGLERTVSNRSSRSGTPGKGKKNKSNKHQQGSDRSRSRSRSSNRSSRYQSRSNSRQSSRSRSNSKNGRRW